MEVAVIVIKHTSLIHHSNNYGCKIFYSLGLGLNFLKIDSMSKSLVQILENGGEREGERERERERNVKY